MANNSLVNEQQIWDYFKQKINNDFGVAALMGNLKAESGLQSNILQTSFVSKLSLTSEEYTKHVDNKSYTNFTNDGAGYGLAQWTYHTRKQALLDYAISKNKSIGDLEMQMEFLYKELQESFPKVLNSLKNASTIFTTSNIVLTEFENPKDQSIAVQIKRSTYAQEIYDKYSRVNVNGGKEMADSIKIIQKFNTRNTTPLANRKIEWIVFHYTAGTSSKKGSAESLANGYATNMVASSDFTVDDETIVQYNQDIKNRYTWGVGGAKYTTMTTSLGGQYYGKCTNSNCINVEVCSNKTNKSSLQATDTDWYFTDAEIELSILLIRYLMKQYSIDINHVIMHHQVTGKICPNPWTVNESRLSNWYNFIAKIKAASVPTVTYTSAATTSTTSSTSTNTSNTSFPAVPFTVSVIVSDLNYRSQPSMSGTIKGQTGKGTFTITQVSNGWGKLKSNGYWIYLENKNYCTIGKTVSTTTSTEYKVKVTANVLNVRAGAATTYKVTAQIKKGEIYTIVEEKNGWGKLKSGIGWISLNYTEKV